MTNQERAISIIKQALEIDLERNDLYEVLKPIVDYANEKNIKIEITGVF